MKIRNLISSRKKNQRISFHKHSKDFQQESLQTRIWYDRNGSLKPISTIFFFCIIYHYVHFLRCGKQANKSDFGCFASAFHLCSSANECLHAHFALHPDIKKKHSNNYQPTKNLKVPPYPPVKWVQFSASKIMQGKRVLEELRTIPEST